MPEQCSVCKSKFGGVFGQKPAPQQAAELVKKYTPEAPDNLCVTCCRNYLYTALETAKKSIGESHIERPELGRNIQISTLHPDKPGYENLGLVTTQIAMGTGPISTVLSSITDLFGAESKAYKEKFTLALEMCMSDIRTRAARLGASAIYGAHITYTELTSGHGMLLICLTGTAVRWSSDNEVSADDAALDKESIVQDIMDLEDYIKNMA